LNYSRSELELVPFWIRTSPVLPGWLAGWLAPDNCSLAPCSATGSRQGTGR